MLTYDIVREVSPDAVCSYPRGRRQVEHYPTMARAENAAEIFNAFVTVPGIRYVVEIHDEMSADRAPAG